MGSHEQPDQEYERTNEGIEAAEVPPEHQRIHELEYMIWLQGNTISAFQRRVYKLEMEIVELISGAAPLLTPEESDARPG